MSDLNKFQETCESALSDTLKNLGLVIENRKIMEGVIFEDEEVWIEGSVKGLRFWIYIDGANVDGHRLEEADFKTLRQLQDAFISIFEKILLPKE
jgi:hypothetical protein